MKSAHLSHAIVGLVLGGLAGGLGVYVWKQPPPVAIQEKADAHADQGKADAHAGEKKDGAERCVELSPEAIKEAGIEVSAASGGEIEETLTLPAEVTVNADRVAHIVPRVSGIVHRVDKYVGNEVQAGEVMAVLESRELAEAKAAYLAAQQKLALARANLKSAEDLHSQQLMPELKFLATRSEVAGAELEARITENKLHALGVLHSECPKVSEETDTLAMYELRAPFSGTVIEKHCSLGEVVSDRSDCFVLADLSNVWANVTVYPHDLARVAAGQRVHLRAGELATEGEIGYVSTTLSEKTRTGTARVVVANQDRKWRPGLFVTAAIVLSKAKVPVLVANDDIQTIENQPVVFVEQNGKFVLKNVGIGRSDATRSEIRTGLAAGARYVTRGAFILKAELNKGSGEHED